VFPHSRRRIRCASDCEPRLGTGDAAASGALKTGTPRINPYAISVPYYLCRTFSAEFRAMPRPRAPFLCRDPRAGFRLERFTAMLSSVFYSRGLHASLEACSVKVQPALLIRRAASTARTRHSSPTTRCRTLGSFRESPRYPGVHNLIHASKPKPANRLAHVLGAANKTLHPLNF